MRTNLWDGQQDNSRLLNDSFKSDPFNYSLAANEYLCPDAVLPLFENCRVTMWI